MTDTCIECGERPAAPGKMGKRCPACTAAIARERRYEDGSTEAEE